MRLRKSCSLVLALLLLCELLLSLPLQQVARAAEAPVPSQWQDPDRNYRIKLNFDNLVGTENLTNFSVPIRLDSSMIDYKVTNESDLKFYSNDQTKQLPYEVEKWNVKDESIVWVQVPFIGAASDQDAIWLYYGGTTLVDSQAKKVWDPNYLLVYHFGERIEDYFAKAERVKQFSDSTSNDNTGLRNTIGAGNSGVSYTIEGKEDPYNMVGRYYESHRGYVRAKNGNVGDGEGQITISAWARANEYEFTTLSANLISRVRGTASVNDAYVLKLSAGKWIANLFTDSTDSAVNGKATGAELVACDVTKDWTYLTLTYDKTKPTDNLKFYCNGALVNTATRAGSLITTTGSATTPLTISKASDASFQNGGAFRGGVDEVKVSKTSRSAAWINAEYRSMGKQSGFVVKGKTEVKSSLVLTIQQPKQEAVYYTPDLTIAGITNQPAKISYSLDGGTWLELNNEMDGFQSMLNGLKSGVHTLGIEAASLTDPLEKESKVITFQIDGSKMSPSIIADEETGSLVQGESSAPLRVSTYSPTGETIDVRFYEKSTQMVKDFSTKSVTDGIYEQSDAKIPPTNAGEGTAVPIASELIKAADQSYYTTKSLWNYPYQRFEMTINDDISQMDELEVVWEGHSKEQIMLYAWNYNTSKWIQIASQVGNSNNKDFKLIGKLDKSSMVKNKIAKLYVAATQPDTMLPGRNPSSDEYDFSFAWMSDTQHESDKFPYAYKRITQWLADNKDAQKLQYVMHTGDIVDNAGDTRQWRNANESMQILDDANIPYGVLQGNHDLSSSYFSYFGEHRFKNKPQYGGQINNNEHHYDLITAGGIDFIILYVGWNGINQASSLAWANQVLEQHKDRKAILAVHGYLNYDLGREAGENEYDSSGKALRDAIVVKNTNIFMVISGHSQASYSNVKRLGGKVVYELLQDYQDTAMGGAAYFRMLYFNVKDGEINMVPYSPITDDNYGFFQEKAEFFTMPLYTDPHPTELATDYIQIKGSKIKLLGTIPANEANGKATYEWPNLEHNKEYTWYAVAKDANGNEAKLEEKALLIIEPIMQSIQITGLAPMKIGDIIGPQSVEGAGSSSLGYAIQANYTDGSTKMVEGFAITSSNPSVASIESNNTIKANAVGDTVITATVGTLSGSYLLTVREELSQEPTLEYIRLSGLAPVKIGEQRQSVITAVYSDQHTVTLFDGSSPAVEGLILHNSSPEVALMDEQTGLVKALAVGQTTISATYHNLKSSVTFVVQANDEVTPIPKLQSITITGRPALKVGESDQLNVFGQYSHGAPPQLIKDGVQFTSSFNTVASVNDKGLVTAQLPGKTYIKAIYEGLETSIEVEVLPLPSGHNGGGPGNVGNNPGNGGSGSPGTGTDIDQSMIQKVDPTKIIGAGSLGAVTILAEREKERIEIPYTVSKPLAGADLDIKYNWGKIRFPAGSIPAVDPSQTSEEQRISLSYKVWDDDLMWWLKRMDTTGAYDVRPSSYMIHLDWDTPEGIKLASGVNVAALTAKSGQKAKIYLPLPLKSNDLPLVSNINNKRLGLYHLTEDGEWQFQSANSSISSSEAVFELSGGGTYMVLEYNTIYANMKQHWANEVVGDIAARHLFDDLHIEPLDAWDEPSDFHPNKQVTRAEFAVLLTRAIGIKPSGKIRFEDVPDSLWYADTISAASEAGIIQGIGNNKFAPEALVTREEMAVMLMRAWVISKGSLTGIKQGSKFQDKALISGWAEDAIQSAVSLNLLKGRQNGKFSPKENTTRAETTQAIHNILFHK
ncbi:DUF2341 domain-containing protein [Cohnella abietis]|nr:DUF2341 domain-containing protein [Cohnella abietis]